MSTRHIPENTKVVYLFTPHHLTGTRTGDMYIFSNCRSIAPTTTGLGRRDGKAKHDDR
jgi:hypothetical protein